MAAPHITHAPAGIGSRDATATQLKKAGGTIAQPLPWDFGKVPLQSVFSRVQWVEFNNPSIHF